MISYYFEDTDFIFKGKTLTNRWLRLVAESEIRRIGDISIIFCSDNYILDVNQVISINIATTKKHTKKQGFK